MSDSRIKEDLLFLAGKLAHRGSNTDNERAAAEYVRDRLREYCPGAALDEFYCPDRPWYLFASYYAEFVVVAAVAYWWPRVALVYGGAVFLAFLAEFLGFRVMGRFLPQFETQNVVGRLMSPKPARTVVVMAHCDSGKATPLTRDGTALGPRVVHGGVALCMLIVLATCAVSALGQAWPQTAMAAGLARWCAVAALLGAAALLIYQEAGGEYSRGANDNASGVAALLRLAQRLAAEGVPNTDVHFVVTGANQNWMHGAREFVKSGTLEWDRVSFLNLDSVGSGQLVYTTAAGMLHMTRCDRGMVNAAADLATEFEAKPIRLVTACSDVLVPLARGFKAMEITAMASAEAEPPAHERDTLMEIDEGQVERAARLAEGVIRRLADTN